MREKIVTQRGSYTRNKAVIKEKIVTRREGQLHKKQRSNMREKIVTQ